MARRSPLSVKSGDVGATVQGLEEFDALIKRKIPAAVRPLLARALDLSADDLVRTIKPIVPTDEGDLAESVRKVEGAHALQIKVVEDGHDAQGKPKAAHVEYGHMALDGSHVEAKPHFWPGYRVAKKRIVRRLNGAMSKGVKLARADPPK